MGTGAFREFDWYGTKQLVYGKRWLICARHVLSVSASSEADDQTRYVN